MKFQKFLIFHLWVCVTDSPRWVDHLQKSAEQFQKKLHPLHSKYFEIMLIDAVCAAFGCSVHWPTTTSTWPPLNCLMTVLLCCCSLPRLSLLIRTLGHVILSGRRLVVAAWRSSAVLRAECCSGAWWGEDTAVTSTTSALQLGCT